MGTHAHATNGKPASAKPTADESESKSERLKRLEREKEADAAAIIALKGEVSRLVEANAKLGDRADAEEKARRTSQAEHDDEVSKRLKTQFRGNEELAVAAIEQKKEWANSLIHDMREVVNFAGLSKELEIGRLALKISHEAAHLEKFCDAQLTGHALELNQRAERKS